MITAAPPVRSRRWCSPGGRGPAAELRRWHACVGAYRGTRRARLVPRRDDGVAPQQLREGSHHRLPRQQHASLRGQGGKAGTGGGAARARSPEEPLGPPCCLVVRGARPGRAGSLLLQVLQRPGQEHCDRPAHGRPKVRPHITDRTGPNAEACGAASGSQRPGRPIARRRAHVARGCRWHSVTRLVQELRHARTREAPAGQRLKLRGSRGASGLPSRLTGTERSLPRRRVLTCLPMSAWCSKVRAVAWLPVPAARGNGSTACISAWSCQQLAPGVALAALSANDR